ncbi:hypothetical protein THAR02_06773 [Trichoderma harzianum]|uniref:Uncharacterized protein n=1 Tax=Trichoderma harzianum TaxID=5544 RepID=A0A0G0A7N8_TRIHA|nr:hypothetical protein THAR02_06773 [Trichoderma harzianum]
MSAMDNTSTTQPTNPSPSSNETIEDGSRTVTATSSTSTSSSSSYCPDCPICNPPDAKSANASAYGTIEPLSYDSQPPEPTFLESTVEACAELCCCICDSPPPSIRTSDWSSTTYPSSISSNSYSYGETETGSSQSQTSDAETIHTHRHRHSDGYKRQQEMRPVKEENIAQSPQSLSVNLSDSSVTHTGEKKKSYSIA